MNKSKWLYMAQFIVVFLTFIFQVFLMIQNSQPPQTEDTSKSAAVTSFLLTNSCVVCGYLLELVGYFDDGFNNKLDKIVVGIVLGVEIVSLIFDLASAMGISMFGLEYNNILFTIIPIISILGIAIYTALLAYLFISALNKVEVKI